jgi:hypothetical protein
MHYALCTMYYVLCTTTAPYVVKETAKRLALFDSKAALLLKRQTALVVAESAFGEAKKVCMYVCIVTVYVYLSFYICYMLYAICYMLYAICYM